MAIPRSKSNENWVEAQSAASLIKLAYASTGQISKAQDSVIDKPSPISNALLQPSIDFRKVPIVQLQLIVVALISGPVLYSAFVLYGSDYSRMSARWNELFNVEYLGYSIQIFLASYIIPWIVCKIGVFRLRRSGVLNGQQLFYVYQSQLLVGICMLLSVVFYGVFWFSESEHYAGSWNLASLLLAALFVGLIIARFPTQNRLEKWWKRQRAWEIQPAA